MLEEIVVAVEDRPGVLAEVGEILGGAKVNIETLSASTYEGRGVIHLVVDDGEDAAEILASKGYKIESSRPVLTATLDDRPGELGRYCKRLAAEGVDISAAYVVKRGEGETELLFAVDDLQAASRA